MKRKITQVETDSFSSRPEPKRIRASDSDSKGVNLENDPYGILTLPGADVTYIPDFVSGEVAQDWYEELTRLETWYHPTLKVYGKNVSQSRSIAAYTTSPTLTVRYSGHDVVLHRTYPPLLRSIQDKLEECLDGVKFNHVMLNRYESGEEYIGKHRDTKENKVIASLSLGAVRTFILTPNTNALSKSVPSISVTELPKAVKIPLASGSVLVMKGDTQKNWKHEIPKEAKVREGRISLTFRQLNE